MVPRSPLHTPQIIGIFSNKEWRTMSLSNPGIIQGTALTGGTIWGYTMLRNSNRLLHNLQDGTKGKTAEETANEFK